MPEVRREMGTEYAAGPYVAAADGPDAALVALNAAQALIAAMPEVEVADRAIVEAQLRKIAERLQKLAPEAPAEMLASIEAALPAVEVELIGEITIDPAAGVDVGVPDEKAMLEVTVDAE